MIHPVRFKLDSGELDKFAHELKHRLPEQAKAATATALNRTAKGAELLAKKNVKQKFQLRNKWTLRSIQSTKTPLTRPIDRQFTLVGSKNDYMARQEADIDAYRRDDRLVLPPDLDYGAVGSLSTEVRQKLEAARPRTIGAAARISGVTPAATVALLRFVRRGMPDARA